ncbi:MAG TPA: AMP-binding protein [Mycobacteriales bacterium]|nr:AMP-binding protein [Mycobacteriales bacterium]
MTVTLATAPTGTTLQRLAEAAWQRVGDRSTLIFEGERFDSATLAARTRRFSQGLRDAGLRPGERVVVCMANCAEVGIAYNAIWRAGGVTTPVLFLLSEEELRHVLADSEAAYVVTTPEFLPKVQAAAAGVDIVRGVVLAGPPAPDTLSFAELESGADGDIVDAEPSSLAALLYTGGTTGRSKGVMLSHDAMSASAWAATTMGYDPQMHTSLTPLPLSHAFGLLVSTLSLHAPDPGTAVLMRWFDPVGWLALAQEHKVQVGAVVPSMLQMVLAQPLEDYDLSALRRIASGAAPLLSETREEVSRRLPQVELAEGYGCTESGALISASPLGAVRAGSVGRPAPGVEVRIETADGAEAAAGDEGEICVRGPNLMTGYWHAEPETAFAMRGGWLHTGDVGRIDDDGYLYVVDRLKDLIIRGGLNVYPRDIEDQMLCHPDVVSAAVVGKPDPTYGEEVVAFVQLRPGATTTEAELVDYARAHISKAKYPRDVRIVDAIPLTSVLKTDRKALRALVAAAVPAGAAG